MVTVSDPIQGTISQRYLPSFQENRGPYHVRRVNGGQDERNDEHVSSKSCFSLFMAKRRISMTRKQHFHDIGFPLFPGFMAGDKAP